MADPPSRRPGWRTKRASRTRSAAAGVEQGVDSPALSSELAKSPGSQRGQQSGLSPKDPEVNTWDLLAEDLTGYPQMPQETGFIGLYLQVIFWHTERTNEHSLSHPSSCADRIRYIRPLDVVKIGEGASFAVFKRYDNGPTRGRDAKLIVMKSSKVKFAENGDPSDNEALRSLLAEIRVSAISGLRQHPNILQLLDIQWDHPLLEQEQLGPTLYYELAQLGTLAHFWASQPPGQPNCGVLRLTLLDICRALEALHQAGVTHGDIKPSNILIFMQDERAVAKLSDFGSAVFTQQRRSERVKLPGISPPWDAPEAGSELSSEFIHLSDIYSFGLLWFWLRRANPDPFGIESEAANVFNLKGDRLTRLDAFKALKQKEDLGPRVHQALQAFTTHTSHANDLDIEIVVVSQSTLIKDPTQRSLRNVRSFLESSLKVRVSASPTQNSSNLAEGPVHHSLWKPHYAWAIPLAINPLRTEPAHRFINTLREHESQSTETKWKRVTTLILIFRCYLEGYGTARNYEMAAKYLTKAANAGYGIAQQVLSTFNEVYGITNQVEINQIYPAIQSPVYLEDSLRRAPLVEPFLFKSTLDPNQYPDISENELLAKLDDPITDQSYNIVDLQFGGQLLHCAAAYGWVRFLGTLFSQNSFNGYRRNLNNVDNHGLTPLAHACRGGWHEVVILLLENGVSASTQSVNLATSPLKFLPYLRKAVNSPEILAEVTRKLVESGVDPNYRSNGHQTATSLLRDSVNPFEWHHILQEHDISPLSFAIWANDLEAVRCLLTIGVIPDTLCFHLAAGLHLIEVLDRLLEHPFVLELAPGALKLGTYTILDSVLNPRLHSYLHRIVNTRMTSIQSTEMMATYLLDKVNSSTLMKSVIGNSSVKCLCRCSVISNDRVRRRLFDHYLGLSPNPAIISEALITSIIWNNSDAIKHLLASNYTLDEHTKAKALHTSVTQSGEVEICQQLVEGLGIDINLRYAQRGLTDLEVPIHAAIACQNITIANYLFEKGANRNVLVPAHDSRLGEITFLGWLVQITWTESQPRIRYLFEEYSRTSAPDFLVLGKIGRSALQHAAYHPPSNELDEEDKRDMMQYLIQQFPGSRHLEYQRVDELVGEGDKQHSAWTHTWVDGKRTLAKNSYHFKGRLLNYESTKDKEYNGTALHHAVRAINFPAVLALLDAGADISAMIGQPLPEKVSLTTRPSSTCAVKENLFASTVLDFALLVQDQLEAGIYPLSTPIESPSTIAYLKKRSEDIVQLLVSRGASHTATFLRKRGENILWTTRKEEGNVAAFRFFKKEVQEGVNAGVAAFKATIASIREELATDSMTPQAKDNNLAMEYHQKGMMREAAELFEKSLKSNEEEHGEYDDTTLIIRLNLTAVYDDMGHLEKAEEHGRLALEKLEIALGEENPRTLKAANNLGAILISDSRWEEAEAVFLQALKGRKKVLGPNDPDTLQTVGNLAVAQSRLGKHEAADEGFERAIRGLENAKGPEDPMVYTVLISAGTHHSRRGRHEEAKAFLVRAAFGREASLGPDHFETLHAFRALADVLRNAEDTEQAIAMYQRAFNGLKSVFGPDDVQTTTCAYDLGLLYNKLERFSEAQETLELVVRGEEKRLGKEHDDLSVTLFKLAGVYKQQEAWEEAESAYLQVLAQREKKDGAEFSLVRDSYYDLGLVYHNLGRLTEAAQMLEAALGGEEKAFGAGDIRTLYTAFELGKVYMKQNEDENAERMFLCATGREESQGAGDVAVRLSRYNLGIIYQKQGNLREAVNMLELALKGEEEALGPESVDTLITVCRLGSIYQEYGRYEDAERSYLRAVGSREKVLGVDHKTTLDTTYDLGMLYKRASKYREAEATLHKAMLGYERVFGPNNSDVLDAINQRASVRVLNGELNAALELYQVLIERREEALGPDHEDTKSSVQKLAEVLQKIEDVNGSDTEPPPAYPKHVKEGNIQQDLVNHLARALVTLEIPAQNEPGLDLWNAESLAMVLSGQLDIETKGRFKQTALLWAVERNDQNTATQLLAKGANIDARDGAGRSALHLASQNGNISITKLLLSKGAPIMVRDSKGSTALHSAAREQQDKIISVLSSEANKTKEYFNIEAENHDGYTALQLAASQGSISTLGALIEIGAMCATMSSQRGMTAVMMAAEEGQDQILNFFAKYDMKTEEYSSIGMTALQYAASNGHVGAAAILLDCGAEVDAKSPHNGWTALFYSTWHGQDAVSQVLIDRGSSIYAIDAQNIPLLNSLASSNRVAGTRFLIEQGISMETESADGWTSIAFAIGTDSLDVLQLLLESGANLQHRAKENELSPLHLAVAKDKEVAAQLLIVYGASVNELDSRGMTPLHCAAFNGSEECTRLLLTSGADVEAKNNDGQTALQLAAAKKHAAIMTLLILGPSA